MSTRGESVRLSITVDVTVDDAVAAAAFLLAARQEPDGTLALPAPPSLPQQVSLIVDESIRTSLATDRHHTGLSLAGLNVTPAPELSSR